VPATKLRNKNIPQQRKCDTVDVLGLPSASRAGRDEALNSGTAERGPVLLMSTGVFALFVPTASVCPASRYPALRSQILDEAIR
jgi:hypothetical protein